MPFVVPKISTIFKARRILLREEDDRVSGTVETGILGEGVCESKGAKERGVEGSNSPRTKK